MRHLMIDWETLGTKPNAHVLSLGAVEYEPTTGELGRTFKRVVACDVPQSGREVDAATVAWWMTHPSITDEARRANFVKAEAGGVALAVLVRDFTAWHVDGGGAPGGRPEFVWANDPQFDVAIARSVFGQMRGYAFPYSFRNERSFRTINHLAWAPGSGREPTTLRDGTYHDPLDDARHQARVVSEAYAVLGLSAPALERSA